MKISRRMMLTLFAGPVVATILAAIAVFFIVSMASPAMAQDTAASAEKYMTCAACHGAQGEGGIGPQLNDQSPEEIVDKLTAYADRETVGPQSQLMWGISATLTPDDMRNLAAYISTLQ